MARLPRFVLPDGIYHVVTRGVDRGPIYASDKDRIEFLQEVEEVVRRFRWFVYALCLMRNHYHLVFRSTRPELSEGMQALNGRYAQRFNRRYSRSGHLFGDRFSCRVVGDEAYLEDVCAYVVNNPVRAGLCERARDWRWNWSRFGLDLGST